MNVVIEIRFGLTDDLKNSYSISKVVLLFQEAVDLNKVTDSQSCFIQPTRHRSMLAANI